MWSLSELFFGVYCIHVGVVTVLLASSVSIVPFPGVVFPLVVLFAIVSLLVGFPVRRHLYQGGVCFRSLVCFVLCLGVV